MAQATFRKLLYPNPLLARFRGAFSPARYPQKRPGFGSPDNAKANSLPATCRHHLDICRYRIPAFTWSSRPKRKWREICVVRSAETGKETVYRASRPSKSVPHNAEHRISIGPQPNEPGRHSRPSKNRPPVRQQEHTPDRPTTAQSRPTYALGRKPVPRSDRSWQRPARSATKKAPRRWQSSAPQ
jgi:hypothetical protein